MEEYVLEFVLEILIAKNCWQDYFAVNLVCRSWRTRAREVCSRQINALYTTLPNDFFANMPLVVLKRAALECAKSCIPYRHDLWKRITSREENIHALATCIAHQNFVCFPRIVERIVERFVVNHRLELRVNLTKQEKRALFATALANRCDLSIGWIPYVDDWPCESCISAPACVQHHNKIVAGDVHARVKWQVLISMNDGNWWIGKSLSGNPSSDEISGAVGYRIFWEQPVPDGMKNIMVALDALF